VNRPIGHGGERRIDRRQARDLEVADRLALRQGGATR
jgi:hypothetical protein